MKETGESGSTKNKTVVLLLIILLILIWFVGEILECNAGKKYPGVLNYHYKVRTKSGEVLPGKYGPCNATHEAPTNGDFIEGYIDDVYTIPDENIPVFIWIEGGTNVHCTTNLKRESWETTKS